MSKLVCHKLKIWIGKYKADISEPTCGSSSALSRRYSREVWGIEGRGKERSVTVGIGLCGGVVQLVRTPACHAGGRACIDPSGGTAGPLPTFR
jgi:hypothetical protein